MSRYNIKYVYGRYEIHDSFNDHKICYSYTQEDATRITKAMNEQHEADSKKESKDT